jgi:hypothetical protein
LYLSRRASLWRWTWPSAMLLRLSMSWAKAIAGARELLDYIVVSAMVCWRWKQLVFSLRGQIRPRVESRLSNLVPVHSRAVWHLRASVREPLRSFAEMQSTRAAIQASSQRSWAAHSRSLSFSRELEIRYWFIVHVHTQGSLSRVSE